MKSILILLAGMVSVALGQITQDEFLDPADFGATETISFPVIDSRDAEIFPDPAGKTDTFDVDLDSKMMVRRGYRVQLIATQEIDVAEEVEARAVDLFGDDVYIVFESPNYKVRVGNFLSVKEAEVFIRTARQNGFPRAWSVPSDVVVLNTNSRY